MFTNEKLEPSSSVCDNLRTAFRRRCNIDPESFLKRILVAFLLAVATGARADPALLRDINAGLRFPTGAPVPMGSHWYFRSCNDGIGCELWRTDGTGPGTSLVADLRPGPAGSDPTGLTAVGGVLYFAANDGTHGAELWKSDGTAQGTMIVRDIVPGSLGSSPESLVLAGGRLFFTATTPESGNELWMSDGSADGTVLVKDIHPGAFGSAVPYLVSQGSLVYFTAFDGVSGQEPWRSDGTAAGTFRLADLGPGDQSGSPWGYVAAGPYVFFTAAAGSSPGVYRTDGTIGGTLRLAPPGLPVASGGKVFFTSWSAASGEELWVSDGTPAGTRLVADIRPGPESALVNGITPLGTGVVFSANDGATGNEPWFSDGSAAGTTRLADIHGDDLVTVGPAQFTSLGAEALFIAQSAVHGPSLWATDGSQAGTRLVKDFVPGPEGALVEVVGKAGLFVYLRADDGVHGRELWRTDGTTDGTLPVTEHTAGSSAQGGDTAILGAYPAGARLLYATGATFTTFVTDGAPSSPTALAPPAPQPTRGSSCGAPSRTVGRLVFFVAYDPAHGCELWRTDGTPGGTFLVKDIHPGPGDSAPRRLAAANGWLYFVARDGTSMLESVWRTNGTEAGTALVESADPRGDFVVAGDAVVFLAASPPWAYVEPWITAIGSSVAVPLGSLKPGLALKSSDHLVATGGIAYFVADDSVHGIELWRSDGTGAGTRLVKDLAPGTLSSVIPELGVTAGKVFLNGPGGVLWASDGTDSGTGPLASSGGAPVPSPDGFAGAESQVFFVSGTQLWRSDGTPAGTRAIGPIGSGQRVLVTAGPWAYYKVDGPSGRDQLWRTDGSSAGTVLVKEFVDEMPNWSVGLTRFGRRLYFHAQDALGGTVTYRTEGTAASTVRLFGIPAPDPLASGSLSPAAVASGFFAFAIDPVAGLEPSFLASEPGLDADGDGIPDLREIDAGRDPERKDNDIFSLTQASAALFAMQQYRDFLAREGDTGGVDYWASMIGAGVRSRSQVIDFFFASPEFQGVIAPVARLYFAYFRRIPDYDGLQFWFGYSRAGHSLEAISDLFAGSPEFGMTYGGLDNAAFVSLVYQNILGRAPDVNGFAYWKGRLDSGAMTRGQLMAAFSESPEYRALTYSDVYVTMTYAAMLRRAPDPAGFAFWVGYLDAGNSGLALVDGFLGSAEYRARFLPD